MTDQGRAPADHAGPLLDSDADFQLACIVSGNETLQTELVAAVRRGIDRFVG